MTSKASAKVPAGATGVAGLLLHPTPSHPVPPRRYVSPTANGEAILFEPTPQETAVWWERLSPLRSKAETGTAVRRFRAYARRLEPELLWLALGELAVEGLPAHYFTEKIARERIARIREVMREAEKREELDRPLRVRGHLRSIQAILRGVA